MTTHTSFLSAIATDITLRSEMDKNTLSIINNSFTSVADRSYMTLDLNEVNCLYMVHLTLIMFIFMFVLVGTLLVLEETED